MGTHSQTGPTYTYYYTGGNSKRVDGELQLRANACDIRTFTRSFLNPEANALQKGDAAQASPNISGSDTLLSSARTTAKNIALEKFRSRAYSEARASLAVDIAEARKTGRMVTTKLSEIVQGLRLLRRGRLGQALRHFNLGSPQHGMPYNLRQSVAQNFLALNLGWAPTVSSVISTLETANKPLQDRFIRASKIVPGPSGLISTTNGQKTYWHASSVRVSFGALLKVDDPHRATAAQFGLTDALSVAWELVPFSWVADYFGNIGQFIDHLGGYPGMSFTDIYQCTTTSIDGYLDTQRTWKDGKFEWRKFSEGTYQRKTRVLLNNIPLPSFQLEVDLSLKQAGNLVALATVLLGQKTDRNAGFRKKKLSKYQAIQ